jgi:tight adherence protein C
MSYGAPTFSIAFCVFTSVLCGLLGIYFLSLQVPSDDREFLDPLPPFLLFIWPLVRVVAFYCCSRLPYPYLKMTENQLQKNGSSFLMMAEEYLALQFLSSIGALFFALLVTLFLGSGLAWLLLLLPMAGYFYPFVWIHDRRKQQVDGVLRTLPAYLDFITMAVEAGLNFSGALDQARKKGPSGPLVNEFGVVLRDMRAGLNRSQALRRMSKRLDIHEMTSFVNAVVLAERMGSSLATVLKVQAEQRRIERFQRAEKKAMEAPVKLVGPLVLFIFPTTFIVLAFPLVMKVLKEGLF